MHDQLKALIEEMEERVNHHCKMALISDTIFHEGKLSECYFIIKRLKEILEENENPKRKT